MKIQSLISQSWNLQSIEVEVLLTRGLPELKFIGLPDQSIKESALRIKTAIKQSGFSWPEADQIIVNLRPNHLKKSSRGLELAVAAGILWETQQIPTPINYQNWVLYGELNLDGSVLQPDDLIWFNETEKTLLITGANASPHLQPWIEAPIGKLHHLNDLSTPEWNHSAINPQLTPPQLPNVYVTKSQADLIKMSAWGRHSLLLAGPAGSGKSLLGEIIHGMGEAPELSAQKELWRRKQLEPQERIIPERDNDYDSRSLEKSDENKEQDCDKNKYSLFNSTHELNTNAPLELGQSFNFWRPFVRPHHTISVQGMIGGGNPIRPGELVRAHHGTLLLDELLEFKPQVIESLREPLETKKLRIARVSGYEIFDCNFHLIATTNLCPCGDFVPKTPVRCRYSLTKCRSYSQKLSGPLADRFQILNFSHRWKGDRSVSLSDIKQELAELRARTTLQGTLRRRVDTSQLPESFFDVQQWPLLERKLIEELHGSHRRRLATLRVSQTLADLKGKKTPRIDELEEAIKYTVTPFVELQRWD